MGKSDKGFFSIMVLSSKMNIAFVKLIQNQPSCLSCFAGMKYLNIFFSHCVGKDRTCLPLYFTGVPFYQKVLNLDYENHLKRATHRSSELYFNKVLYGIILYITPLTHSTFLPQVQCQQYSIIFQKRLLTLMCIGTSQDTSNCLLD